MVKQNVNYRSYLNLTYHSDGILKNKQMQDRYLFVNRLTNLDNFLDMVHIKDQFFKIQDLLQTMDHFVLEAYRIPSNFNELQKRMFKEFKIKGIGKFKQN